MKSKRPILLVEDDQVDAMAVKRAFKEIHVTNRIDTAENGEVALSYLMDTQRERPCIILLDLNMPKMNGIEFLSIVKQDKILRKIPVVVLTTSKEEEDRVKSFNLGIAGYMIKPVEFSKFVDVVRTIDLYWTLSLLPEED
jgi:CheY-like chemotaxis protein